MAAGRMRSDIRSLSDTCRAKAPAVSSSLYFYTLGVPGLTDGEGALPPPYVIQFRILHFLPGACAGVDNASDAVPTTRAASEVSGSATRRLKVDR